MERMHYQRLKYQRKYYQLNKKHILEYEREWRKKHPNYLKNYFKKNPFKKLLINIKQRCNYPKDKKYKYYGGKGIRCFLELKDLIFLWNRDKANLLKQPSIDRINSIKNYTLDNCQFIEMSENRRKRF